MGSEQLRVGDFAYLQEVPAGGFQLVNDFAPDAVPDDWRNLPLGGPWLVQPVGLDFKAGTFLEDARERSLHRTFAQLLGGRRPEQAPERIRRFASRWGALTSVDIGDLTRGDERPTDVRWAHDGSILSWSGPAEPLALWEREIRRMNALIELWDIAGNLSRDAQRSLRRYIRWGWFKADGSDSDGAHDSKPWCAVALYTNPDGSLNPMPRQGDQPAVSSARWMDEGPAAFYRHGDYQGVARDFVFQEVNGRLRGHVDTSLQPFTDRPGARLLHWPDTLLTALYALLALELTEETRHSRTCDAPDCTKIFRPDREPRSNAKYSYCSSTCRRRHWAQMQAQKRREASSG